MLANACSFARRYGRFVFLAFVLAAAVPASFAVGTDGAAYAQRAGRGGGGGGDGTDGGGPNPVLRCLGGICPITIPCDGPCYPPPECEGPDCGEPPCVGDQCGSSTSNTPPTFITYKVTPAGCQSQSCTVDKSGTKMKCFSRKAEEKMCTPQI